MRSVKRILCLLMLVSGHVFADNDDSQRFVPFNNNYILYPQYTKYRDGKDDVSLEGHYSFKYIFYDCKFKGGLLEGEKCRNKNQVFFSYTGEFDFYVDFFNAGRESGPVINRTSNPALHWKRKYNFNFTDYIKLNSIDLSIQHRSDGQVIEADATDSNGQLLAQQEYLNDPNSDYFDAISRGSDYIQLATEMIFGDKQNDPGFCDRKMSCYALVMSLKGYLTHSDNITWGPLAGSDTRIHDYDILRIKYTNSFNVGGSDCDNKEDCSESKKIQPGKIKSMTLQFEYTVGHRGLATDSLDINFIFPVKSSSGSFEWPWYIGMHFGPMDRLSNYTEPMTSLGIGLMFTY